jgi:hypothetical protein
MVTIEKGQGFHDGSAPCSATSGSCAEDKILAQIAAIKKRRASISTVFYMNSVLDWYFYRMHYQFLEHPEWWLRCSKGPDDSDADAARCTSVGAPFYTSGDRHFNPPEEGMLVFDDSQPAVRQFWLDACFKAVATGLVDGCFSDSSEIGSHSTASALNATANRTYEAGKVLTMTEATARFGGVAGQPYPASANGTLVGKFPNQLGINALQIEMFDNTEAELEVFLVSLLPAVVLLAVCDETGRRRAEGGQLLVVHEQDAGMLAVGRDLAGHCLGDAAQLGIDLALVRRVVAAHLAVQRFGVRGRLREGCLQQRCGDEVRVEQGQRIDNLHLRPRPAQRVRAVFRGFSGREGERGSAERERERQARAARAPAGGATWRKQRLARARAYLRPRRAPLTLACGNLSV